MKTKLLPWVLFAACSSSAGTDITKTVGSGGGDVQHSDGSGVNIPPGALGGNANITVTTVDVPAPEGTVLVGPAHDFGPEGTSFSAPVTVTLPFTADKIPAGRTPADISIYTAPRGSTQYTRLPTTLGSGSVSTTTSHFTVYLPAVPVVPDLGSDNHPSSTDLAGPCSPSCVGGGTLSCSCTESCGGHTYVMTCKQSNSLADCTCAVDGVTQSSPVGGVACDQPSSIEGGFLRSCAQLP